MGRDSGGHAFAGIEGLAKSGAVLRGVFAAHGTQAEVIKAIFGHGEADQAASILGHEVDCFGSHLFRSEGEIAFVFAILVVDHDDHAAGADFFDCGGDVGKGGISSHGHHTAFKLRRLEGDSSFSTPRNRFFIARTTQRVSTAIMARKAATIRAASTWCRVASQVKNTASVSSPALRVMFEKGSGDGVTAARAAVLPPWAARAMAPPARVASNCFPRESWEVAPKAIRAAAGILTKVCRAFQNKSKAGILSAKNSMVKRTPEAAITHQLESRWRPDGKSTNPPRESNPRVATVA